MPAGLAILRPHTHHMTRTRTFLLFVLPFFGSALHAHEGMWLPTLLKGIEGDMQAAGLKLSAEDIYSVNNGSLKDAIVLFGGGCTAEVISGQGLILTNHHCGYGRIQEHSSLENDYLKHGFWAATKADELRNPGLTATFIVRIEDVTDRIVPQLAAGLQEQARNAAVAALAEPIASEAVKGTHYSAVVRPFNYGNAYYLIVTETFRDVRLVGTPPSSIGKFGGDADNWMWPRHTGDFSLFRIYAGPGNIPADPADANMPFTPRHSLPISLDGVREGDFAMIFGFPGQTQRYLTSYAVEYVMNTADPVRIAMREASLGVIDQAMRASDLTRIQYAARQSSISNAYKKWIGELRGLKELDALNEKRTYEAEYRKQVAGKPPYDQVLPELEALYMDYNQLALARDLYIELAYYGPTILRFAEGYHDLTAATADQAAIAKKRTGNAAHFKNYDADVDKRVFKAVLPIYLEHIPSDHLPIAFKTIGTRFKGDTDAWVDDLYTRTVFADAGKLDGLLARGGSRLQRAIAADPAYVAARSLSVNFLEKVRPSHGELSDRIETAMRTYVQGMMAHFPDKTYWPDANSTLRLSYGKVEGSAPRNGMLYLHQSTLDGVMEKYVPGDAEFDVPERLIELYRAKDYGPYGENGAMPVCFTSSLHTTGGNSGSPVLNGRGELIGLNFDRTWESTMSDIRFDPAKCRNISVDARYVLFIIDKYAGAKHLIDEMRLVHSGGVPMIDLPIHR